jgi:3',5'-cyclic AMP phosphodiesterase CpdA
MCLALLFAAPLSLAEDHPAWQRAGPWPDRIIASLTANPASEFSVNWRTSEGVESTVAEITLATPAARFDIGARTVPAITQRFELDLSVMVQRRNADANKLDIPPVAFHSVTFSELESDTVYAYRVQGAEGNWSSWRQIRTGPESGPLEFLFFGDSQDGIRSHISRLFETAAVVSPNARFMLHAGDLVNSGINDQQWAEWFEAGGRLFGRVPSIPVPGNHDYVVGKRGADVVGNSILTPLWRPHLTLPVDESLPSSLAETAYEIRYTDDLHLFAIDSSAQEFDVQMTWLQKGLSESDATWKLVYMHHPFFSWVGVGEEKPEQTRRRALFDAVLEAENVDLVLSGHRHSYQRAESGPSVNRKNKRRKYEVDTVFVVTASTVHRGVTKVDGWQRWATENDQNFTLTRWGDYVPLFGIFTVDGRSLRYRAIDALGGLYDEFTLSKSRKGKKTISNRAATFDVTRDSSNTGAYEELEFN